MSPDEARHTDPQQRMFLQCAYHAMEDAGIAPRISESRERTAVFAACGIDGYLIHHLNGGEPLKDSLRPGRIWTAEVGNEKDYIATRVSYQLDLGGPSYTVNSACSSGLVAIAQGVEAIRRGDCDVAISGASSLTFPNLGYLYGDGFVNSMDGTVRPFDKNASGTLFGDSVGAVVLKRLSLAQRDRNRIYAIVRGSAITNDGKMKAGYSAPRAEAQARAIRQSMKRASVQSKDVSYVECHATATKVGDAIEMRGLRMALGPDANPRVGSVKGNIGHANCAAGLTGFIKTVLCLYHRTLVPTVHFRELNARIKDKFEVQTKTETWQGERRFAGVSSFGVGGTNVHVTLACPEEEIASPEVESASPEVESATQEELKSSSSKTYLLPLSAKTNEALQRMCDNLARYLQDQGKNLKLCDVARTLQFGREHMKIRVCVTASSIEEAARKFQFYASTSRHIISRSSSNVVFLFPGQGTQFPGMGRAMYVNRLHSYCYNISHTQK